MILYACSQEYFTTIPAVKSMGGGYIGLVQNIYQLKENNRNVSLVFLFFFCTHLFIYSYISMPHAKVAFVFDLLLSERKTLAALKCQQIDFL